MVEEYTRLQPNNTLARFLPALQNLAGKGDRFTGLNGFDEAVRLLGGDPGKCTAWGCGAACSTAVDPPPPTCMYC